MRESVLAVIDSVYATADNPAAWPRALGVLSDAVGAQIGLIATPSADQQTQPFYVSHNHPEEAAAAYAAHFHTEDVVLQRALERNLFRVGNVMCGEDIVPRKALKKTGYYHDFLRHMPAEDSLAAIISDGQDSPQVPPLFISLFREPGAEPFMVEDIHLLRAVLPHLRRSVLIGQRLAQLAAPDGLLCAVLESFDAPVMVLSPQGRLLHTNTAGGEYLARWHRQSFGVERWPAEVAEVIREALTGRAHARRLPAQHDGVMELVMACPLGERAASSLACSPAGVLLSVIDAHKKPSSLQATLGQAFGLSPAEARLLPLLSQQLTPTEMAALRGVGVSTIRSQLAAIYEKTGTRRQQDLLCLLACLPSFVGTE